MKFKLLYIFYFVREVMLCTNPRTLSVLPQQTTYLPAVIKITQVAFDSV